MCCATQPPHAPKCRHSGCWRSGLSVNLSAVPSDNRQRSPGKAKGTYAGPLSVSATPSPCAPRCAISTTLPALASLIFAGSYQILLIAGTTAQGRFDHSLDSPTGLSRKPARNQIHRALAISGITHNAGLAHGRAPSFELRLDQCDQPSSRPRERERHREDLGERDEAHVRNESPNRFRHLCNGQCSRIGAFEGHNAAILTQ